MGFLAKDENAGDRALKSQNSAAFGVQSDDYVLVRPDGSVLNKKEDRA
jgi:hypothetical protein